MDGIQVSLQRFTAIIKELLRKENRTEELVIVLAQEVSIKHFQFLVKSLASVDGLSGVLIVGSSKETVTSGPPPG
jgi:hypothetical protein